jgi:hypothetical protein
MCEGSQVNPKFYQGFVEVFFDRGRERRNEIQTEVLAAFAGQFPTRFLEEFLAGKSSSTNIAIRSVSPTLFTVELISTCQQNCPSNLQIAQSDSASGVLRTNNIGSRPYDICGTP